MNNVREFETKDFYMTALLMEKGFDLTGSRDDEGVVYFTLAIDDEEKFSKIITDFVNYNSMVNMQKFIKILAKLRHIIKNYKE